MTLQTRYRLTGAIFLVALFALLAPMLFDADGVPRVEVQRLPPSSPMQPVQAPPEAFGEDSFEPLIEGVNELRDEVDSDGFVVDSGARLGDPSPGLEVDVGADPAATSAGDNSAASGAARATGGAQSAVGEGAGSRRDAGLPSRAAYVVRVASFSQRNNATTLQRKLRDEGYESFLSTQKQGEQVWTRVLVGPYLDSSEAQRVQQAISAAHNLEAQVLRQ